MTATNLNSIRTGATVHNVARARRTRRARTGASEEFRTLVAEFDARRHSGRGRPAEPSDAPVRPRHVIAAEGILSRMRQRLAATAMPDAGEANQTLRPRPDRAGPVHALRAAKRIVLAGLDSVDHRLQQTLRRHGFDRVEVAEVADAVMSGIGHRAELALNHLPLAPRPVEAAQHLFANALDRIADNLARALGGHGLGHERIAEISHLVMRGIDERVEAALDGLAENWVRTRSVAGAA